MLLHAISLVHKHIWGFIKLFKLFMVLDTRWGPS